MVAHSRTEDGGQCWGTIGANGNPIGNCRILPGLFLRIAEGAVAVQLWIPAVTSEVTT
jgi:hypothetical protein